MYTTLTINRCFADNSSPHDNCLVDLVLSDDGGSGVHGGDMDAEERVENHAVTRTISEDVMGW